MPYEIGTTLKKYRIEAQITVKQISDILIKKGFKASEKTIYSWESGNSQPSPDALLIMCDAYGIQNILSAFGYNGYKEDGSLSLNMNEQDLIEKYRALDSHGREMVDFTLQKEWERSVSTESLDEVEKYRRAERYYKHVIANAKKLTVNDLVAPIPDEDAPPKTLSELANDLLNAAHAIESATEEDRRFDDDIMDDDEF